MLNTSTREMQIRATARYPSEWPVSKRAKLTNAGKDKEKREPSHTVAGRKTYAAAAAAAAKSLQSCPTLCDPIDCSPAGSPVPGILQARTLEWVATAFSIKRCNHCKNSMVGSQQTKNRTPIHSRNSIPGYVSKNPRNTN